MKIQSFSKTYEERTVLNFPGMELHAGNIYAIIGANGSGKSTFAKILAGIIHADQKNALTDAGSIGYMPQKNYAFRMSTCKNILLNGTDAHRAEHLMDALHIRHLENKQAHRLSGGETARMALVRLMMGRYDLVILDEPTAGLDPKERVRFRNLIGQIGKDSIVLLSTHIVSDIEHIADEVLMMKDGNLIYHGAWDEQMGDLESFYLAQFEEGSHE